MKSKIQTITSVLIIGLFLFFAYGSGDLPESSFSDYEDSLKVSLADTLQYYYDEGVITEAEFNSYNQSFLDTAFVDTTNIQAMDYYENLIIELEKQREQRQISIKENDKKIKDLIRQKFIVTKDEFNNLEYYRPKSYGKNIQNAKTLIAGVNSSGYIWLSSVHYSDKWLNHNSVTVLIDGKKIKSPVVNRLSENYKTEISGSKVWEIITYKNDTAIIPFVAINADKTIKVRFNGEKYIDDITLSSKYKQAIVDCYELSNLIKSTL